MTIQHPTDALRLVPEPRAISDAPRDGTMLRLWVRYPEDGSWTPLADAYESWTVGFNNFDNTEEDRWQIVGWCWSHDHLVEAADDVEVLGWLPFHGETAPASPLPEGGGETDWQSVAMWMCFSASVIKSGEPWTDQCQQHYDEAKAAFARLAAPTGAK